MASKSKFTIELLVTAKKAQKEFQTFGSKAVAAFNKIRFAALAVAAAITGIATATIALARKQQQAESAALGQLRALGRAREWDLDYLKEQANLLQEQTTLNDDLFISAGAVLGTFKNLTKEELPKTLGLIADMTTIYGGDLMGNAKQFGRILSGQTDTLSRFGIILTDEQKQLQKNLIMMGEQQEANAFMFSILSQKMGDAAKEYRNTAIGEIDALRNNVTDALEEIGLLIAEEILPKVREINALFKDIGREIAGTASFLIELGNPRKGGGRTPIEQIFNLSRAYKAGRAARLSFGVKKTSFISYVLGFDMEDIDAVRKDAAAWIAEERAKTIAASFEQTALSIAPMMGTKTGLRSVTGKNEPTLIDMLGIDINAAPDVIMPALGEIESIFGEFEDEIKASITRISDTFTDAIMGAEVRWEQLINDLIRMFIQSGIEQILTMVLTGGGSAGGGFLGGIVSGIGGLLGFGGGSTGGGAPIQIVTGDPSSFVQLGRQTITPDNAWRSSLRSRNYSREILPNG